jgi:hypothetical protein
VKLYLVRWLHDLYYPNWDFDAVAPPFPATCRLVKAFTDPVAAEHYRQALEHGTTAPPASANPFLGFRREFGVEEQHWNGLADVTSLPPEVLADWVSDLGLTPPQTSGDGPETGRAWADWWDAHAPHMTAAHRAGCWRVLDRLRFFEIVETELDG